MFLYIFRALVNWSSKKLMSLERDVNIIYPKRKNAPCSRMFSEICQSAFTCSKLTIETLEQGVKYIQC